MIYREIALPQALAGIAFCAWQFVIEATDPPAFQHQVPPDGTTNLLLVSPPVGPAYPLLVRPSLTAMTVPVARGTSYGGIRLRPEAARAVTGREPQAGTPEPLALDGPLAPLWADLAALASGEIDWAGTAALLGAVAPDDPGMTPAIDALVASGGAAPIARLAAQAGLSLRQFRRRFHAAVGVPPKQYADVQRVRRALILSLADPDWAGIAHEAGFADQPHLARDIKLRFGAATRRVHGYLGGIHHELLLPVPFVQDRPAQAA